jgi:signal transduction histidine kinase
MTILRRLTLSFLAILLLFGLNLVIYFVGNQRRQSTVEDLRRAIERQILISSIDQSLHDIHKHVTLLSQVVTDVATPGSGPTEVAQFIVQLDAIKSRIVELRNLSDSGARARVDSFADTYAELSQSWRVFYENFGRDQSKAILELAVRADPLSQKVLQEFLPQLQQQEKNGVEKASANFYQVARFTDRITILIFGISSVVAIVVAYLVSRHLTRGLGELKLGAALIGSGNLDRRIALPASDELGDLARAFNDMTENLMRARTQLTRINEQEKEKSEELERALGQLHKAQDQLVVQQKLASLGSLTAGIAHEIKNPLNFIINFSEVSADLVRELREALDVQKDRLNSKDISSFHEILADLEQNVSKIVEHGKRADNIVRGMLMHSRGQAGEPQETNINTLVSEYVKLAYHGMRAQDPNFNVTIKEDYDPSIEPIRVIPHDLSRVVLNITNNACYAAQSKKIEAGDGFSPTISVHTRNLAKDIEIRIRDNGNGIPAEIRKKIFEPFFTTKPAGSGTGLGLSMSYDIVVQEHKGQIRVESEERQYTEFIITLPKEFTGSV